MCETCWEVKYNSARVDNDKVRDAVSLIQKVYEHNCVGGALHIVLDDWNLDDSSVDFCGQYMEENKKNVCVAEYEATKACYEAFKEMTVEERASALALASGFWKREE